MLKDLWIALKVSVFTLLLTGIGYPFVVTGFSYLFFHKQATGSLVMDEQKKCIGSELIGQSFTNPAYFFSRPSAAGKGYDGTASGGSNLGPTSQALLQRIHEKIEDVSHDNSEVIPIDFVTASGSGLDPHISPATAYWQASRIAAQRNISLSKIMAIIDAYVEPPQFGLFGSARVNVLKLNIALDQHFGPQVRRP